MLRPVHRLGSRSSLYRIHYKISKIKTKIRRISPKNETIIIEANLLRPTIITSILMKHEVKLVDLSQEWSIEQIHSPKRIQSFSIERITEYKLRRKCRN